jgi:hypothetical protein
MLMTPPQMHMHFELLSSAGMFAIMTVGEPGTHGAGVFGMHGIGVSTPSAAAVSAATVGLAGLVHMPNGMMFTSGLLSMMFAAGMLLLCVRLTGSTTSADGATPNEHISCAPIVTCKAILYLE